jgi:hypothetical protein
MSKIVKNKLGFSENLKKKREELTNVDKSICSVIENNGKNMNKMNYFKNRFGDLKKGGKRKTKNNLKYRLI